MSSLETLVFDFAQTTPDYVIVVDPEGRLRYANPAFERGVLAGRPAPGELLFSLLDGDSADRARQALATALEGDPQHRQVELCHSKKDGQPRPTLYTLCRVQDGVAGIGRDKTPDLELLGEIVQLNIELENQKAKLADVNTRLEKLATTDQITGLYNRYYFFGVVHHMFEEARRYNLPLCCMMIDADHFKNLNDTYGHIFGDHVLKVMGERLKDATRRSDVLARYGGEEFVIVAPNTDIPTGTMLAERLRASIEKELFVLSATSTRVTISLGISGTQLVTSGPFEDLMHSADLALYSAKQAGRNRVHAFQPAGE